ncbi:chemotaxis protein CheA [Sphingomonas sp. ac-8]|uniref:chemotaxis protein CheA n=1 Tax=Sphingomonas sp. ac-8 TaxID=3242977 RepID=UPI003A7FE9A0
MDDLLQEFIAETRETLETLSGEIVAWEAAPHDRARLDAIFRFVHTVKGSCGFLDLPRLERLSHAAEDVLAEVRAGTRTPDRALVDAVLAVVDRIGALVDAIDAGVALPDAGEDALIAALALGGTLPVAPAPAKPRGQARSVRLGVDLLDRMMSGMSDMVLARNELARVLREGTVDPVIEAALARLSVSVADLRDTVTRTRMQRIETLFAALPRMVRDTAAALGKSVTLTLEGSDVEVDREMVDAMRDPLVHMVRNAIDHGIESAEERRAAGKPLAGRLTVAACQAGNQVVLEISDDGRGIDVERLVAKLVAGGSRSAAQLAALDARRRAELIFEPGLSVRDAATVISGRGVGMDVVRAAVEQIGGRVLLDNRPGQGLHIEIRAPLTLSIVPAIVVRVGAQQFAVPRQIVEEIVAGARAEVHMAEGVGSARVRGREMPSIDLATLLDVDPDGPVASMLIVIELPQGSYALAVDAVVDHQELVVKPASPPIMAAGIYAGKTLPDSGRPMLLLDCAGIAAVAGIAFERAETELPRDPVAIAAEEGAPALVFVDLDGVRRVVPLASVDRVERRPVDAIELRDGRLRLALDGGWVPAEAVAPIDGLTELAMLRLTDGRDQLAYAARDAGEVVHLPDAIEPACRTGRIAGTVLLDRAAVELIDVEWLLARDRPHSPADRTSGPVCLVAAPADGPLARLVRPVLEAQGYRVVAGRAAPETPAVVLMTDTAACRCADGPAPVVRLRSGPEPAGPDDASVYRHDTGALLAAVADAVGASQ